MASMTTPDEDAGVPLAHYREHEGCGVQISCNACAATRTVGLEAVITRLLATGQGGPQTGIRSLAHLMRRPCACRAVSWEVRPAFGFGAYTDGVIPPALLISDQTADQS